MTITFLGTGTSQGVPIIGCDCEVCQSGDVKDKRLRSSILVEDEQTTVVVDTGPDFREQMLREKVKNLDAVVFTHAHRDHTAGLDDIRAFNFLQKKDMDIYLNKESLKSIQNQFDYIFQESKYPGVPRVIPNIIDIHPFTIGTLKFIPIQVLHYKLPVLGFRIKDFTYITDANYISEEEKNKIRGSKVLVLNALRKEKHISHFTLNEAIELAKELNVEQTYFTHLSHQMGTFQEIEPSLPKGINLAYDGLKVQL